ncbi:MULTISPECIES: stage III sporulation protein AE [Clostridium]|uniref:Stage III sporulation protein AE n=1 Tax=Clostridium cibarium TaxID=2762247 RepID=A0ABR8PPC2_9CLOT|nr:MULTISPECIES: stage III sporulation protein AE [Clostridium]MBD7910018.1 stage III sporulation protein AE [Clostridium cibarium]
MKIVKRLMILIVVNLIIISFKPINVYSEEKPVENQTEDRSKLLDESTKEDLNKLYDYINKRKTDVELMNELDPIEYVKSYIKDGKGNISIEKVWKALVSLLFKEVRSVLKLAVSLIAIAIICALLNNLQDAFNSKSISQIAFYACYAVLVMVLSKSFIISISVAKDVINDVSDFMAAMLPVLVTMISLAGGIVQATTIDPIVMGAVVIIPRIYTILIIPLILIGFVLQFSNNLSEEHKIDNLCKLVKQSTIWIQGIIITIFIGLLTIRGITSTTIDAVTLKTTKFAVDNFVPIVGKAFSDAITAVAGYSLIIKNAISSIGLAVIILIILYPIIKIVLMVLIYKLSSAVVEPISDRRITSTIAAAGDSLVLLLSSVLSVSLMFFVLLAIMASAGKFIVGG